MVPSALTLLVVCQEGHPACKNLCHFFAKVLFQNKWRKTEGNRLTKVYLETAKMKVVDKGIVLLMAAVGF